VGVAARPAKSRQTKHPEAAEMDMQLDSTRIRTERERRAWSQEHLAEVSGLSLRTIQRVETSGSASFETTRALAAVFELDASDLRANATAQPSRLAGRLRAAAIAAAMALGLGVLFVGNAAAGDVMLDVGLSLNSEKLGQHQLVAPEGKSAEIRLEGQVRLFVNPIVTEDGSILLSMRLEEPSGSKWVQVGEPRVMVGNGNEAVVKVTSPKGNKFEIAIRPRRM
jgi:transcriptional regulator with XRE-family HTH domain